VFQEDVGEVVASLVLKTREKFQEDLEGVVREELKIIFFFFLQNLCEQHFVLYLLQDSDHKEHFIT